MEIKTMFSVGDTVYYIKDNQIHETRVVKISVDLAEKYPTILPVTYKTEDGQYLYEGEDLDVDEIPFASVEKLTNYLAEHVEQ